jgi:hypothetical protein
MRKFVLLLFIMSVAFVADAQQTDSTLQQYAGKYNFKEGSPVTEIVVTVEKGTLMANSAMGASEFKWKEGDVFEVVAYSGIATFRRNDTGKVIGVRIEVGETILEGSKAETNSEKIPLK